MPIDIRKENIYSAFPCPKLCSSSWGFDAILFPINVRSDEKISETEFTKSAIIDWLFVANPIIPFIIIKKIFPIIPKILTILASLNLSLSLFINVHLLNI